MIELTVLLFTLNEEQNIGPVIRDAKTELDHLQLNYEILVIDGNSRDRTREIAQELGARVSTQTKRGYAAAVIQGFEEARGEFIVTLDVDGSHPPSLIAELWKQRENADLLIASRFVHGGKLGGPMYRQFLSWVLSVTFPFFLGLPAQDVSSGYRLYRRRIVQDLRLTGKSFEIQLEILVKLCSAGYSVSEVPLIYEPRKTGRSNARVIPFGIAFLKMFHRYYRFRNSSQSVDYDHRAYTSLNLIQRYWQQSRYRIISELLGERPGKTLDLGCGTSRLTQSASKAVAADIEFGKLRFLKNSNRDRVQLDLFELPFQDASFDTVVCSQVISHVAYKASIFTEIARVLRPGGRFIVGAPDYGTILWPLFEAGYRLWLPEAYGKKYLTHFTARKLTEELLLAGFQIEQREYIAGCDLYVQATKA